MLQQQQQQTQLLQQILAGPRGEAPVPVLVMPRHDQDRPVKLPEFAKLAKEFYGDRDDPTGPESWIDDLEKAFDACAIPEERKISLAVFQLKKDANNWWRQERLSMVEPTYAMFRQAFFQKYFPDVTREHMTYEWLLLK